MKTNQYTFEEKTKMELIKSKKAKKELLQWQIIKMHSEGLERKEIIEKLNTNKTMVGNTICNHIHEVAFKDYNERTTKGHDLELFVFNKRIYTIEKAKIAENEFFAADKAAKESPNDWILQQDAKMKGHYYANFRTEQPII